MIEKTLGIVLKQIKYGETGLIAHLYTRRWGRLAVMVPGARSASKSRKAHLFQPLTLLDLDLYFKQGRDLHHIREVKTYHPFVHLAGDPVKSSVALFLAEVLVKALREEEPNEDLYDFLDSHIQYLDVMEKGVANFHLYFLLRLTRYLGFSPSPAPEGQELWFDLMIGSFTTFPPAHGSFLTPDQTTLLRRLLTISPSELSDLAMDRSRRFELLEGLLRYYHLHLEGLGEIRSHSVLQAIFD